MPTQLLAEAAYFVDYHPDSELIRCLDIFRMGIGEMYCLLLPEKAMGFVEKFLSNKGVNVVTDVFLLRSEDAI